MRTAMLLTVLTIIPCGCGALVSGPPGLVRLGADAREVGERYMTQIVDQSGKLDGMEFVEPPAAICSYSLTHLPTVDWDNVVATKWKNTSFTGPGPSEELKRYGIDMVAYKPVIRIDLRFEIELKDGTSKFATLSLRPTDDWSVFDTPLERAYGTLKIIPPSGRAAWNEATQAYEAIAKY